MVILTTVNRARTKALSNRVVLKKKIIFCVFVYFCQCHFLYFSFCFYLELTLPFIFIIPLSVYFYFYFSCCLALINSLTCFFSLHSYPLYLIPLTQCIILVSLCLSAITKLEEATILSWILLHFYRESQLVVVASVISILLFKWCYISSLIS